MYKTLLLSVLLLQAGPIFAPPIEFDPAPAPAPVKGQKKGEVQYVQEYAKVLFEDYELEYYLPDGRRVDILTDTYAYECDFSYKYTEGVTQALAYALATNRSPGLMLLMKGSDDERYNQCLGVITDLRNRGYRFDFIVINVETGKIWRH